MSDLPTTKIFSEKTEENIMGTLPVGRLLIKMSVPLILSMLSFSLYNIIDSMFVARLGDNALTALSLSVPINSLNTAITMGFGIGMNIVLSKELGSKNILSASTTAGNGIFIGLVCAMFFMIFGLFFSDEFYRVQTDIKEIQLLGISYTSVTCIFSFGLAVQIMLDRILVASGKAFGSMLSLLSGTIVNLILDPILIFGYWGVPPMGITGAAAATIISQISAAAVAFAYNIKYNRDICFRFDMLKPRKSVIINILFAGFPVVIQQSLTPVMTFIMNQILLGLTFVAPAVYVIYAKLQKFFAISVRGLKNSVISIISYNYGAGKKTEL